MPLQLLLEVMKLGLEFAIRIHDDMPEDVRRRVWERHDKSMQRFDLLFDEVVRQLTQGVGAPAPPGGA